MQIWRPGAIDDVFAIARGGGGFHLAAGATAIQLEWIRGAARPEALIDLTHIDDLKGIVVSGRHIRLGALSSLAGLIEEASLAYRLPLLVAALKTVAGPSIRNMATIGGNIAGRTGCLIPALLALDAQLEIAGLDGSRCLPLGDWLALPRAAMEIIIAVHIDAHDGDCRWIWRKIGLRAAFTPAVVNVVASLTLEDERYRAVRLAVGGGVVAPSRLAEAERRLSGCDLDRVDWADVHACIVETVQAPDDDFRTSRYRRLAAANAIVHGLGGIIPSRTHVQIPLPLASATPPAGEIVLSREALAARWHVRPDIEAKVGGRLAYLTDRRGRDMLVGRILRSCVAHATIVSIDTAAAEALPGVACVVTHRDIAGDNAFGIVVQDQPALCHDKVRYLGDSIAAVAAVDAATAERALALIRVVYEELPAVNSAEAALAAGAPLVHAGGNLQRELFYHRGDIAAAFACAAHVVEATYVTPRQMHGFMETEGGYAQIEADGTLLVAVGGQYGLRDRMQLSRILGLAEEKIRVITSPTGGAFGGKDELTVQPALALLALKSGQPVRLQLSRAESVIAGQKRNPMTIRMRTACDAGGRLLAQEVEVVADAGAYASLGPGVLETALEHAAGPYVVDNVSTHGRIAYTNNGVCGAFRGFGANQMTFAIECQMDRLAALCELDPAEMRARNLRAAGSPGYLGQAVAPSERIAEMLDAARASSLWGRPQGLSEDGEWLVGTGMALNYQGNGLGSLVPDPAGGRLSLTGDGFIEGAFGLDEMGQGLLAMIRACVAEHLGCGRDDVRPVIGDTRLAPESGSTTASRGSSVVWAVARMAGPEFTAKLCKAAGEWLGRDPASLVPAPGGVAERGSNSGAVLISYRQLAEALGPEKLPAVNIAYEFPKNDHSAGNARYIFAFGAALARVAISRVTGQVRVLDLHQHTAAGPVMDVAAYLGQIEGGAVQGLGFTLTEDLPMRDGRCLSANLDTYMLPSIADAPDAMRVLALESLDDGDPLGPRGVGELGIGAVTPAIANAVASLTGQWPEVTPFPPEDILAMLEAAT